MRAKRKNGEGTWGEKIVTGKKYVFYRDPDLKYTYGSSVSEVKKKLKEKQNAPQLDSDTENTYISEYAIHWLYKIKRNVLKQQTFDNYEMLINSWNLGDYSFDQVIIKELDDEKIQRFIDTMVDKEYSLGTIRKHWTILKQCLEYGMIKKEIPQINLSLITIPTEEGVKKKKKQVAFATAKDLDMLYNEANKMNATKGTARSPYFYGNNAKAIIFMGYTGLRISELTALQWKDVDFKNKTITVSHTHAIVTNRDKNDKRKTDVILSTPKRYKSRTVPLSDRAFEQIIYFDNYNKNHKPDDYVFLSQRMTPLRKRNIYTTLARMLNNCDANPDLTPHSLRHGFGSILLENKVDIKVISELLGHEDIRTTYNIYIGITDEQKKNAISTLNSL